MVARWKLSLARGRAGEGPQEGAPRKRGRDGDGDVGVDAAALRGAREPSPDLSVEPFQSLEPSCSPEKACAPSRQRSRAGEELPVCAPAPACEAFAHSHEPGWSQQVADSDESEHAASPGVEEEVREPERDLPLEKQPYPPSSCPVCGEAVAHGAAGEAHIAACLARCWAGDNSDEDVGGGPAKRCGEDGAKGGGEDLTGALERQRGGGSGDEFNREDDDPGCQWEDDDEWPAIEEYFSQHPNASGAGGGGAAGDQRGDSDESDEESPFPDDDVDELMREVAGDGAMNEDADADASEGALELRPRPLHDAGGDQELTPTHAHAHEGASCVSDEVVALLYGAGLEDHVGAFVREEICMLSLPLLSEADFLELGVTDKGARAILRGLVRERDRAMPTLPRAADASGGAGAVGGHWGRRAGGPVCARESATAPSPDAAASRRTRITDFFVNPRAPRTKRARAEHITAYFATESGRTLPPPPARDTPAATGATAGRSNGRRGGNGSNKGDGSKQTKTKFDGEPPPSVRVPGTSILVDGFRYRSVPCLNYILTHFHADHYVGLTKHMAWCSKESVVWCTPITAALVHARIGTPRERLRVLAVGKSADIEGHRVTFVDANHCPGAVMVHVQLKGGGCVLHTGDCRWDGARMPAILSTLPPAQTLVLDTTYCNPQCTFPPQAEVIDFVEKAVKAEAFNGGARARARALPRKSTRLAQ